MKDLGVSARYAHSDGYTSVCYTKDDRFVSLKRSKYVFYH